MKFQFYSLLLVTICATLFVSCSKSDKSAAHQSLPMRANTTLQAVEVDSDNLIATYVAYQQPTGYLQKKLSKLAPKVQKFTITPSKREQVVCAQGTTLTFDPGVFLYASSGLPVTEPIDISITEYLTDADIIIAGLTTKSGDHIIETAGMIYVDATANGKPLIVKQGDCYQIEIPANEELANMELFYGAGVGTDVNWVSANYGRVMPVINMCGYYNSFEPGRANEFYGGLRAMYDYLHQEVIIPKGFENVKLAATSYVNFYLDSKGGIYKVHTPGQSKTYADSQMVKAFELMPCWNNKLKDGEYLKMMIPIKMDFVRDPTQIPARLIMNAQPKEKKFSANYINDKYLLTSAKLGWINCDRFTKPNQVTTDLFVELDSTYDASVRLVFSDIRAILPGARFTKGFNFRNVPINTEVTVVAIRNIDNQMQVAITKCNTNKVRVKDLKFVEMTPDEMEVAFNNLNNETALTAYNKP